MTAEGQECTSGVTVDMFSILLVLVLTQVLNWSNSPTVDLIRVHFMVYKLYLNKVE